MAKIKMSQNCPIEMRLKDKTFGDTVMEKQTAMKLPRSATYFQTWRN